eukprot:2090056-Pyramimonas_sp.AAC.1
MPTFVQPGPHYPMPYPPQGYGYDQGGPGGYETGMDRFYEQGSEGRPTSVPRLPVIPSGASMGEGPPMHSIPSTISHQQQQYQVGFLGHRLALMRRLCVRFGGAVEACASYSTVTEEYYSGEPQYPPGHGEQYPPGGYGGGGGYGGPRPPSQQGGPRGGTAGSRVR